MLLLPLQLLQVCLDFRLYVAEGLEVWTKLLRELAGVFVDRAAGTSKMSWRIAFEAMLLVPRMRRTAPRPLPPRRTAR